MSVTLFGAPQIRRGDEQINIQRRKDLALLIYLVSTSQAQSRDTLATLLWQDQTQTEARSNLRKSLSRLKSLLGEEVLVVSQNQVGFNSKISLYLDTTQFNSFLNQFRKHGHVKKSDGLSLCEQCQKNLEEATRLYSADFLQGFSVPDSTAFDEWQFFQSESLRQSLAEILEHLVHQSIHEGKYHTGIEYGRRWLALDRLHEPAHKQLMILYALDGQHAAAIRQFQECARLLKEELGAEPEVETLRIFESIRTKKLQELSEDKKPKSGARQEQRLEKSSSSPPGIIHNIPIHHTPFVAREKELKETTRLLKEPSCRLLTLLGPGGSGKTRLAAQIASSVANGANEPFKDGIWFIPLAPLTDSQSVVGAIAQVLQVSGFLQGVDTRQKLLNHLGGRRLLLILDNFEHLLGIENIELVSELLSAAPNAKILITSRERLNIAGETIFLVEGLETPVDVTALSRSAADPVLQIFGSLQLFEQSARRVQPTFKITAHNYRPIARICHIVQGMPLGIELAASWLQVLSLEEISAEIERSLDFLQGSWRDLPDRQRSLRAVFESSWALLEKQSRPILKALSVFRTSFTREAAQAIAGASPRALLDLTNKSWIQRLSTGRYQIHELLRQYAFEKLQTEKASFEQVRKQYCAYYADFSFAMWQMLKGADQARAFTQTEHEFENMRTAWMSLVSNNELEMAVERMLPLLFHYCEIRGKVPELKSLVEAGLSTVETYGSDAQRKVEIILRTVQGAFYVDGFSVRLSVNEAIFPVNMAAVQRAWSLSRKSTRFQDLGFWGILLAFIYGRLVKLEEGMAQLEQLRLHFQRQDAAWEAANVHLHVARLLICNRLDPSKEQVDLIHDLTRAMELFSSLDDRIDVAHTLSQWGQLKFFQQDLKGAIQQWEAAHSTLLTINEWSMATEIHWPITELYLQLGYFERAFAGFRQISNTYLEHGLIQQAIGALSKESFEKVRYGDLDDALSIRRRCLAMVEEAGLEYQFGWNYWEMGEVVRVSGDLAEASIWFERSRRIFENFADRVGSSFYYRGIGDVALAQQDYPLAHQNFAKCAELARTSKHTWMLIYALNGLGRSELEMNHLDLARQYFQEALEVASRVKDKGITLVVLAGLAELLACRKKTQQAIEVGSLVQHHYASWRETKNQMLILLPSLKKSTTAESYRQAQKKGRSLDLWDTVNVLTAALAKQAGKIQFGPKQKAPKK